MDYDKSEIKSEYLERLLSGLSDEKSKEVKNTDFIVIVPEPGFCMKLYDSDNKKVFINICKSEKVPRVKDMEEEQLYKLLENMNDFPEFRIPMSIGEPHSEKDHVGNECICYDVVINNQFLKKLDTSPTIKGFFFCLCFEGIEDKYKVSLKRDWKILQNKKVHGFLKEQYLRTVSKPIIIDCDDSSNVNKPVLLEEVTQQSSNTRESNIGQKPVFEIIQDPVKGLPEYYIVEIQLPKIKTSKSLLLEIGENHIVLSSRTKIYYLDFYLPEFIIPEETLAEFNVINKVLTITLKVKNLNFSK